MHKTPQIHASSVVNFEKFTVSPASVRKLFFDPLPSSRIAKLNNGNFKSQSYNNIYIYINPFSKRNRQ